MLNLAVQGQGVVAVSSDGPPLFLDCSRQPTFVDPHAVTCWSTNLQPQIKSSFSTGSPIGRGSSEPFHGPTSATANPSKVNRSRRCPDRATTTERATPIAVQSAATKRARQNYR
nr:AIM24 family protein [Actinomyces oris]